MSKKGKKRKVDPTAIQLAPDPKVRKVEVHHIAANTRHLTEQVISRRPAIPLPALATPIPATDEPPCEGSNEKEEEPEKKTVVSGIIHQTCACLTD